MSTKENRVFITTLNGMLFTVDKDGNMAITTDGTATRLFDPPLKGRFK